MTLVILIPQTLIRNHGGGLDPHQTMVSRIFSVFFWEKISEVV
jgi:hypothetical protein